MVLTYMLTRMRRSLFTCAVVCLVSLAIAALLCVLHAAAGRMDRQIDQVCDELPVSCAVTNLTGTQTDDLDLPYWVVNLFWSDKTTIGGKPLDRAFSSYIQQVQAKKTLQGRRLVEGEAEGQRMPVVGVTGLAADRRMRPEDGCTVTWLPGFGQELFGGGEALCLVPWELYETLPEDPGGGKRLALALSSQFTEETVQREFQVAGTYVGGSGGVYCPWAVMEALCRQVDGWVSADSLGAVLRNNWEMEEFRDYASRFFATVDPEGTRQPWENSTIYTSYPYAFEIYDGVLRETQRTLARNRDLLELVAKTILVLSLGIGFLVGFLLIRNRSRELALLRTLGTPKGKIFLQAFGEQLLLSLLGIVLGAGFFALIAGQGPVWGSLGVYWACDLVGAAAAIGYFLRGNLLAAIKEET